MKYFCAVLAAFTVLSLAESFKTKCFPAFGKYPFDESKFSGDWYVVAVACTMPKPHGVCNKINYSYQDGGNVTKLHVKISVKESDGTEKNMEAIGQSFIPKMTSTTQVAWKKSPEEKHHGVANSAILATDYESYAISTVCKEFYDEDGGSFKKFHMLSILSRKPTMDHAIRDTLKSVITSFDFDISDVKDVDNSGC